MRTCEAARTTTYSVQRPFFISVFITLAALVLGTAQAHATTMTYEFETDTGHYGTFSWDPLGAFIGFGAVGGAETAVARAWGPDAGNQIGFTLYAPGGGLVLDADYTTADIVVWQDRIYCDAGGCQNHDFDALYFDLYSGPGTSDLTTIHFDDYTGLVYPYYEGDTGNMLASFLHDPIGLGDFSSATLNGTMTITSMNLVPEPSTGLLVSIGLTGLAARRRSIGTSSCVLENTRSRLAL